MVAQIDNALPSILSSVDSRIGLLRRSHLSTTVEGSLAGGQRPTKIASRKASTFCEAQVNAERAMSTTAKMISPTP